MLAVVYARPMSPSADSPFKRCARTSAPAMAPKSPTLPSLRRVSRHTLPHPVSPLFTPMTPALAAPSTVVVGSPHGPHIHTTTPTSLVSIIATPIRTAPRPSSPQISCIKTNNKIPFRVSRPSSPAIRRAVSHSFVPVANYSPLKVTSSSPYSSPSYTIYPGSLLSPLPSQRYVAPGLVSGASMFY